MNAHTASLGTGGALGFQRTLRTCLFGEMNNTTGNKWHFPLGRTLNNLSFPIQYEGLLVESFAVANRPGFTIHFQVAAAFTNQMATQISSIDMQFFQESLLPSQICTNRFSHAGFGHIRRGDPDCSDEVGVQIVEYVPLVPIHAHTATFASMAHLPIFNTDASIFRYPFYQALFPGFID